MTRLSLMIFALWLLTSALLGWTWQSRSAALDEATRLRSTVRALEASAARASRASAERSKRLEAARAAEVTAARALERALERSPDWAATQVPPEVQNAP